MVFGIGQPEFPEVLVSMASFAVLGADVSVKVEMLPDDGEMRLANSSATVWSPVLSDVVFPVLLLVPVPVGMGTMGVPVAPDPEPVGTAAATQGPVGAMFKLAQVVSPISPGAHAARVKPARTKADTDARRMIDSHDPKDSSLNLYEFR
jgi:hypothetical protein